MSTSTASVASTSSTDKTPTSTINLFVHGFPREMDEDARREFINDEFGQYGEIANIAVIREKRREDSDPSEKMPLRGFCFVEISEEGAQNAIDNLNGAEYDYEDQTFQLVVKEAEPRQ
jgi:RNA recognition motif-containing protein